MLLNPIYAVFSLSNIFEEISEMFEYTLKPEQKLMILDSPEVKVNTDQHLLKNSVINLVSNAIKYSPEHSEITVVSFNMRI